MKKIMIVEDDMSIAKDLSLLLINSNYETETLTDFENAKDVILNSNCDLILLDINIPFISGEILLKDIRKESNIPIIMVTSKNNEVDEAFSISYGADDYITKPYNPTILLLRILNIFKRCDINHDIIEHKGLKINISKCTIDTSNKQVLLTKNEMIIFTYLLNNRNKIVTRDELMTSLWNSDEYISDNALSVNISRLRSKLEELGYSNIIETRKKLGYILL